MMGEARGEVCERATVRYIIVSKAMATDSDSEASNSSAQESDHTGPSHRHCEGTVLLCIYWGDRDLRLSRYVPQCPPGSAPEVSEPKRRDTCMCADSVL